MSDLFRERMTLFLMGYVNVPTLCTNCDGIMFDAPIKQGLKVIVRDGIMTPIEITKELLKRDVILPTNKINEWIEEAR
jgi:hypothetical protein